VTYVRISEGLLDFAMYSVSMGQMGQSTERNMPSVYTCIKQTDEL